jgi:hypothetical protein
LYRCSSRVARSPCTLITTVPYALIHTRVLPAHRKSPCAGSRVFANCSISFATWHVVPESRMKDCSSGYLEFLVIKVEAIITKLIAPISLPYSHSLDIGSIVGVADCDFLIAGVFKRGRLVDRTSSCRSGVLLILSFLVPFNAISTGSSANS